MLDPLSAIREDHDVVGWGVDSGSGDDGAYGDGHEALLVNGGGIDGSTGAYFANADEDLHAVGALAPLIPGAIGCIVIRPDGRRLLARAVRDPLA